MSCFYFFWLIGGLVWFDFLLLLFYFVLFRGRENEQQRGIWLSRVSYSSRWHRFFSTPLWHFGEMMWLEEKWHKCSCFPEIISQGFIFNLFPSILWYKLYRENPEVSTAVFGWCQGVWPCPIPTQQKLSFPAGPGAGSGFPRVLVATKPQWKHPRWAAAFSSREDTHKKLGYFSRKGPLPGS